MAIKIKLTRMGRKKRPFFRIVVAEARSKRDGRFIANLGYFDPTANQHRIKIDKKLLEDWLKKGAKPTEGVQKILKI